MSFNMCSKTRHRRQKVVLLTGAAGFIGSNVADLLLGRGDIVIAVDEMNDYYDVCLKQANLKYLTDKYGSEQIRIYYGDICNLEFMSNIFEKERPMYICHLAARAGVRPSILDPYIYVHSNIEGTTRLLDLARLYACKNFVYASSSSVYGCSTNEVLSESDLVEKPVSPYAATKKACELLAYTFHHLYGLNCTGLRFFTVYGPRGRPDMAPFKFIDRIFNGVPIQQYGDGSTCRDYTYIDDIVDGVVRSIDRPLGYEVINLGNGRPFQLSSFIQLVESCVGRKAIIEILPEQPGDVERTCADISKAKKLLGYQPKVPFEVGISRTAEWYKQAHAQGLIKSIYIPEEMTKQLLYNFIPAPKSPESKPCHNGDVSSTVESAANVTASTRPPVPPAATGQANTVMPYKSMGGDEDIDYYRHVVVDKHGVVEEEDNDYGVFESDDESGEPDGEDEKVTTDIDSFDDSENPNAVAAQDTTSHRQHRDIHNEKLSAHPEMVQTLVESMSDLELSSYVEKTPIQITFRSNRFITRKLNIYINK